MERKVSIDRGGRAFDRPETWLPRCITLAYGADVATRRGGYSFVRVLLERLRLWIGYSTPRHELKPVLATARTSVALASS